MTTGPLEYVTIEFEGNHFTGEILPELRALRDQGVLRVVDLVLIQKDRDGNLTARELSDLSEEEARVYDPIAGDMLRLFTPEDVEEIAVNIPNNSSAAAVLLEHRWAARLNETISNAHGRVLTAGLTSFSEVDTLAAEVAAQQNVSAESLSYS